MNKRKVPKLRFKGFSDDWEQRKLGEEAIEIIAGGDVDKEKVVEEGRYPIYANALTNDGIVGYYNEYYRVKAPAVTVTGRGEVGHAQARMVDFTPVVRLLAIRSHHDCYFLENAINNHKVVVESTGVPQLTVPQLSSYDIFFPSSIEEETKIGEYFHSLDNLITLHQRKLDKLKIIKKSMLENCFPKNGEKIPKFRFDGFCGDWEQRKLSEVADKVTEKNSNFIVQETFTNSAEFGVISQRDFFDHDISNAENIGGYYVVRDEDFVYNPRISVTAPVGPVNRNKLGRSGVMSPLYTVFRTHDIDTTYLEWFFKSSYWHPFMFFNGDSGARSDRFSIKDAVFFEMPIPLPSIDEQKEIGAYLDKIDNLITLHQRKLEKLKVVKKSMLESMFV